MRFVDLSVPLDNNAAWAPWWARTRVRREGHRFGAFAIRLLFGLSRRHLRGGLGWANDEITLSTHGTTHLDAPWHYGPTSQGAAAKTIDQVPLEWCYGPGVKLDMRHKADGEAVTVEDLRAALARIPHTLSPGTIVLIQTGGDRYRGTRDYFMRGIGMSAGATRWLIDQGIKVAGTDAWGWDVPLPVAAERARDADRRAASPQAASDRQHHQPERASGFWEAHYAGIDREYCHLEQLTNLDALPAVGFGISCFPLKVAGGSAGPARVVAILP